MVRERRELRRAIGPVLLSLYGLGTILGAGIYVIVGEVAAVAGTALPTAFGLAALIAGISAFSFAEWSSRLPRSAGEAAYVAEGLRRDWLAKCVGLGVIAAGIVSSGAIARGFVGYLNVFVTLPNAVVVVALVTALTALALWGIAESLTAAAVATLIEVAGLVYVIILGVDAWRAIGDEWASFLPADLTGIGAVLGGALLAFYAFIGFEDMVNVAEEVREPTKTLPKSIVFVLIVSSILYLILAITLILALPAAELAASTAPLALLVERTDGSTQLIALVALFAVVNGALIQIIMGSRVLYGMAQQGYLWRGFSKITAKTQTPWVATIAVGAIVMTLALAFPVGRLAGVTSLIALTVFTLVNASLWVAKGSPQPRPPFCVPRALPLVGAALSLALLGFQVFTWLS